MKRTLQLFSLMAGLLLASSGAFAQETWKELIVNGDFEGSDFSSFSINHKEQGSHNLTANDIVIDDKDANNHCVKLSYSDSPTKTQFIIKFTEPLSEGNLISFSMRTKSTAAKNLSITTEELGKLLVKTGGEWNSCTYEGVVSKELAGCQTLTFKFDRNFKKTDIFYFDDISLKVKDGSIPIEFADPKVKEICVTNWDTNKDGELSLAEAALVTDLGQKFRSSYITSFNELQYFVGLTSLNSDFYGCSNLTSIIIPNNVINITHSDSWSSSFMWCWNLTSVTLGDKVESIGDKTFYNCTLLTSINIPNSVTTIGDEAFQSCISLKTLNIPSGLTSIGESAFLYCSGLTSIVVEEGNKYYDSRDNCNALIKTNSNTLILGSANSIIPNTVTTIDRAAFSGCSGLTSITIPKSVTTINYSAFNGCSGLVSIVVEEGNPIYDSRNNCNAIIETAIDYLITGSNNTTIPDGIKAIASYAFSGCSGLTSITIPSSVTNIEEYAFQRCSGPNLLSIIVEEGNPTYDSRNNCNALIETATDSLILGCKNAIIPNSVKAIAPYAFSECSGLTSIVIPNGIKTIVGNTFSGCSNLTTLIFGNSIEILESFAFVDCPNIKDIYCYAEQVLDAKGMYGNSVFFFNKSQATLHVPAASIEAYKAENPWNEFGSIVALIDTDPNPTGITNINNYITTGKRYYSLDGKQTRIPQRGLNIVKMNDGTTKKVLIK